MAEETQPEQPANKSSAKKRRAARKSAKSAAKKSGAAPAAKKAEALPTEKPVPNAPEKKTSQYVVTIDNQTGLPVKIEKLSEATGRRTELTEEEYGQAMAYASLSPSSYNRSMEVAALASAAETDKLLQAYYRGVADYLNALTSNR